MFSKNVFDLDPTSAYTAEVIIGVNDEDFNEADKGDIDMDTLYTFVLKKIQDCCRLKMAVSLESVKFYDYDYTSDENTRHRGVRLFARLGDCHSKGDEPCSSEQQVDFFKKDFTDLTESLMTYCSQKYAKIYFRGELSYIAVIKPPLWSQTLK